MAVLPLDGATDAQIITRIRRWHRSRLEAWRSSSRNAARGREIRLIRRIGARAVVAHYNRAFDVSLRAR